MTPRMGFSFVPCSFLLPVRNAARRTSAFPAVIRRNRLPGWRVAHSRRARSAWWRCGSRRWGHIGSGSAGQLRRSTGLGFLALIPVVKQTCRGTTEDQSAYNSFMPRRLFSFGFCSCHDRLTLSVSVNRVYSGFCGRVVVMARSSGTVVLSRRHTPGYELLRRSNPEDNAGRTVMIVAGVVAAAALGYGIYQLAKKPSVDPLDSYGGFRGNSIDPMSLQNPYQDGFGLGFDPYQTGSSSSGSSSGSSSRGVDTVGRSIGDLFRSR